MEIVLTFFAPFSANQKLGLKNRSANLSIFKKAEFMPNSAGNVAQP